MGDTVAARFVRAFGTLDWDLVDEIYDEDVLLYAPFAWKVGGVELIRKVMNSFHTAYPGLSVTLHDEFYNADATRGSFRYALDWHNTGPFQGNEPTGERGSTLETHTIRLRDGRITEQIVGANTLHMKHLEMVTWRLDFPRVTPDPALAIVSAP
jgi:hypothetical protein